MWECIWPAGQLGEHSPEAGTWPARQDRGSQDRLWPAGSYGEVNRTQLQAWPPKRTHWVRTSAVTEKNDSWKISYFNRSVQPDAWQDHSVQNKAEAEREIAKAQHLREAIYHLIEQTNNDLKVQNDATNFDFRKRMYEMKRAKEELEYQIKKV